MGNKTGKNQHGVESWLSTYPDLPTWIQQQIDGRAKYKEIISFLKVDKGVTLSLRALERIIGDHCTTVRKPKKTPVELAQAVLDCVQDDPKGTWGARRVQEKLAFNEGVHAPRDFVNSVLKHDNPLTASSRDPKAKKKHRRGIWSIGPNEEWCMDGHQKISISMGIEVYGIVDKASRMELTLIAFANTRVMEVPVIVYLLTVKERKGIPVQTTTDKGSETGAVAVLHTQLRELLLGPAPVAAHMFTKSTYNITRERAWRGIWEKELSNVLEEYVNGQRDAGYDSTDDFHRELSRWIWGEIVQRRLNKLKRENELHRVRNQPKINLPSGFRRIDIYTRPEDCGPHFANALIPLTPEAEKVVDELIAKHVPPNYARFASEHVVNLAVKYVGLLPKAKVIFDARHGWTLFRAMLQLHETMATA